MFICPGRKSPGGVFLSLVKKNTTQEEKSVIFRYDKANHRVKKQARAKRLKMEKKAREMKLKQREEEWKNEVQTHIQLVYIYAFGLDVGKC